ncbi:MAG: DUF2157 domain-containing protein [Kiritimatiellae bacterium]|nr:DUF2157 domain-containing protein [Kiritimatiellia bacterium]MCO5068949.1 DUF2157 domain-containing protein [Kiritimatiellia bacterium]
MANKHNWIQGEIDAWEREGLINLDMAAQLRARYSRGGSASRSAFLIGLAALGALLLGGGIILLLAYNWADLSRPIRVAFALFPLLAAQALALFGVVRERHGAGWREGIGLFWTLSIGAAVAMVSQIYHISGSYDSFLLTWVLLALPVVYLLRSSLTAALYVVGVTAWAIPLAGESERVWFYWPLLLAVVPLLWRGSLTGVFTSGLAFLRWVVTLSLFVGVGITFAEKLDHHWMLVYSGLISLLYLLDLRLQGNAPSLWHRPMRVLGVLGFLGMAVSLTFQWPWRRGAPLFWWGNGEAGWDVHLGMAVALGFACAVLAVGFSARKRLRAVEYFPAMLFFFVLVGQFLARRWVSVGLLQIAANLLVGGYGLTMMVHGFRRMSLGAVNFGMLVLAMLVIVRFLDSEVSILVRALVFIGLGAALLGVNVGLSRRFRRVS